MNMLLLPPIAFALVIGVTATLMLVLSRLSAGPSVHSSGKTKAYACGEDVKEHRGQPDYSQFFPFAIFFTIMHVVALIVATVPVGNLGVSCLAVLYLLASGVGLLILYKG